MAPPSRAARLYLLDEPIGGVDPATRDYILSTIISNYNPDAAVVISTTRQHRRRNTKDFATFMAICLLIFI